MKKIMVFAVLAMVIVFVGIASADSVKLWKWTDEKGVEKMTSKPETVPKKYKLIPVFVETSAHSSPKQNETPKVEWGSMKRKELLNKQLEKAVTREDRNEILDKLEKVRQEAYDVLLKKGLLGLLGCKDSEIHTAFGGPNRINRSVGPWGIDEQWIYDYNRATQTNKPVYMYFRNGILTSLQD